MHIFSQSCLKPLVLTYLGTILHFCKFVTSEYDIRRDGSREEAYETEVRRQIGYSCWDVIEMLWDCGQYIRSLHAVLAAIFPMCESDNRTGRASRSSELTVVYPWIRWADILQGLSAVLQERADILFQCVRMCEKLTLQVLAVTTVRRTAAGGLLCIVGLLYGTACRLHASLQSESRSRHKKSCFSGKGYIIAAERYSFSHKYSRGSFAGRCRVSVVHNSIVATLVSTRKCVHCYPHSHSKDVESQGGTVPA